jgi:hypothetical protein
MKMPDAAERKVLIATTLASACVAFMPREWVSAGVLLLAAALMYLGDRRLLQREKAASGPRDEVATSAAEAAPHAESAAPPPAS